MNIELFQKHKGEFLLFERVKNKTSQRRDLHAFNLLDKLLPGNDSIVASAEHDQIWLSVSPEKLMEVATEDQIIELLRCGITHEEETDSLTEFV